MIEARGDAEASGANRTQRHECRAVRLIGEGDVRSRYLYRIQMIVPGPCYSRSVRDASYRVHDDRVRRRCIWKQKIVSGPNELRRLR